MNESQLRAFIAVIDSGSFAAAGRALHMSQPGVSRAVRGLEAELGAQLIIRRSTSSGLTAAGVRALPRCRAALADFDALRQETTMKDGRVSGRVRVGSMPSISRTLLPQLLGRIADQQPGLTVSVIDGHDDELVDWLHGRIVDIAVVAGRRPGLDQQHLATDELLVALPNTHDLALRGEPVQPADLEGIPFIQTKAGCERLIISTLAERGLLPNIQYEVTEASSIITMVSERLGVSVIPALAVPKTLRDVTMLPLAPPAPRDLSLATLADQRTAPAILAVLAEAAAATHRNELHEATARQRRAGTL